MEPFKKLSAIAAPFPQKNVDTDFIIRVERCTGTPREQLGSHAFEMARFLKDGSPDPDFVLNQPRYRGAQILVCGEFFGTGSSREMAVWALAGMGIRCLIAPSFGQIFYGNCFQNGVLPIVLDERAIEELAATAGTGAAMTVDLVQRQLWIGDSAPLPFQIDDLRRESLLAGLDVIGLTLQDSALISRWQQADRARRPWIWDPVSTASSVVTH